MKSTFAAKSWSSAFTEVLFVDATLPDYLTLVNGARPEVMVLLLSPLANPWEQMTASLSGLEGVQAVHIASHGTAAELVIAGHAYTGADLSSMTPLLSSWKSALTENADILLYGCDVASSPAGHAFIETLSTLTGADVAASVDATGPSAIGADWNLEANAGEIETVSAFNQSVIDSYEFRLASTSFTSTAGTNVNSAVGAGKLVTFNPINLTETGASAQLIVRAKDVDYGLKNSSNVAYAEGNKNSEWDGVYIQKIGSSDFSFVGFLNGTNNNWSYTTFDISSLVANSGVGSYVVRVVPDDDGTQSQKSNGGTWVVTVPSVEIFLGGSQSISALSEVGQEVTSTWSADQVGAYTIQYILTDSSGRAVAQANVDTNETEVGANQTNAAKLVPNSNFYTSWSALPSGTYTLEATLIDSSGVVRGVKTTETVLDMTAPTVKVTSDLTAFKSGDAGLLTLTFSEAPVGLTLDDLTSSNGTLSGLQATADAKVYQVKFTPAAGFEGDATVGVKAAGYTDAAGNAGETGSLAALHVDTLATKVQVSSDVKELKAGEAASLTLTFSEAPVGLTLEDLASSNGSLSGLQATADAKVYQVKFTPAAGFEGDVTVGVKAGSYTDAAGNAGEAGSLAALHVDTLATKVRVSSDVKALKAGEAAVMTLTFSEAPVGLTLDDLTSSNGTLSGLQATADAKVYQVKFTPAAGFEGDVTVGVKAGSYTDAAGNAGEAGNLSGLQVDTTGSVISNHVLSQLDFETTQTWGFTELPTQGGGVWHTDNVKNLVEIGTERVYGSERWWLKNHVIELAANPGDASNLYTQFETVSGMQLNLSFDYSARSDASSSAFEVIWGGNVIDTIDPGKPFAWKHADYTLNVLSTGVQGLELRAVDKSSYGAVLDNMTLSATQLSTSAEVKAVTMSKLDFQNEDYGLYSWHIMKMEDNQGWFTDNALGKVELGRETVYGGKVASNRVIELAANPGDLSNLYTNLLLDKGAHVEFTFDISARQGSDSKVNVLWDGEVIDVIDPGQDFGWKTHRYDLVANGDLQRLELQAVNHNAFGAVLDNLTLNTPAASGIDHAATVVDGSGATVISDAQNKATAQALEIPVLSLGGIQWGDGSGYGNVQIPVVSTNGGGNNDTLTGTANSDVIFGDGSGGGQVSWGPVGLAGGGADVISGGSGNDLIFGDGFAGSGAYGGYGGGGGGITSSYASVVGGIGASAGLKTTGDTDASWLGDVNSGTRYQAIKAGYNMKTPFLGGAGVRNGNLAEGADTDTVSADLSTGLALSSATYGGRSVYNKVLWDLSQGSSGFGVGNVASDVAGTGNNGNNVDERLYSQTTGTGADVLRGGMGSDWLMGGGGADTYVWKAADLDGSSDYLVDFNGAVDKLQITDCLQGYTSGAVDKWVSLSKGLVANSPFLGGTGSYSKLTIDADRNGVVDQTILFRSDALSEYANVADLISKGVLVA